MREPDRIYRVIGRPEVSAGPEESLDEREERIRAHATRVAREEPLSQRAQFHEGNREAQAKRARRYLPVRLGLLRALEDGPRRSKVLSAALALAYHPMYQSLQHPWFRLVGYGLWDLSPLGKCALEVLKRKERKCS